jgi:hypothetical protein
MTELATIAPTPTERACARCGHTFTPVSGPREPAQRFCTRRCAKAAQRARARFRRLGTPSIERVEEACERKRNVRFLTREEVIDYLQSEGYRASRGGKSPWRYAYLCPVCTGWHPTSKKWGPAAEPWGTKKPRPANPAGPVNAVLADQAQDRTPLPQKEEGRG